MPNNIIVTWAAAVAGSWQTALDWTPNTVPGAGDNVFITPAGTYTVTDSQTTIVDSVATAAHVTLDITGGTFTTDAGTGTGANAGTIKVEGGATLAILPSTVINTGTLANAGTMDFQNTTINGGTLANAGVVAIGGGGISRFVGVSFSNASGAGTGNGQLALDGNAFTNFPSNHSSAAVTLTTANSNDVIILDIVQNGANVNSVSDTTGLTWHQRAVAGAAGQTIYEYYAIAPNALSSDVITVNFTGTASYADLNAFGVSGANTLSPFDTNVSLPSSPATSTGSVTTSNANDFIFAGYRFGLDAAPAAGAGWTASNASGGYYLSEYQIVSATQVGLVATASTADENGGIVDAIAQASSSDPVTAGGLTIAAGSTLDLDNTTIMGGTLSNSGTVDTTGGATSTLNGVSATDAGGIVIIDAGSTLDLSKTTISGGTLSNAGTVDISGGGISTLEGVSVGNEAASTGSLALDGTGFYSGSPPLNTNPLSGQITTSAGVTLTTANAGDVIVLFIYSVGTTVANDGDDEFDADHLTWHFVAEAGISANAPSGGGGIYEYYAVAPHALSADAIGVNFNGPLSYVALGVFAISGAKTSAPFDTNASLPATPNTSTGSANTNNANDFIFAGYGFSSSSNPNAGPGWNAINASGGNFLSEYQIVSATQSDLVATASSADENGGIVDAVVQASGTPAKITVDTGSTLGLNSTTITGGNLSNAGTVDVTGGGTSTLKDVTVSTSSLALDGNAFTTEFGNNISLKAGSASVALTTATANDVIILYILQNGTTVSAVSDAAGLIWHQRAVAGTAPDTIYEYYAIAPNALSADAITVNFAGAPSYVDLNAFGVSGANTSSPFDNNVSVPATPTASTGSITTSNTSNFIFAGYRFRIGFDPERGRRVDCDQRERWLLSVGVPGCVAHAGWTCGDSKHGR